jgi:cell division protein FtsQ
MTQQSKSRDDIRREQAARIHKRNMRKRFIFRCVLVLLLAVIAVILSLTVFFKTAAVTVKGTTIYKDEQIIKASGIKTGDNMFLIRRKTVQQSVEKSLPYIGNLTISRRLPGTVVLNVTPAKAAYTVKYAKGYAYLSKSGKVLATAEKNPCSNTAMLSGIKTSSLITGSQAKFSSTATDKIFIQLNEKFKEYKITGITALDLHDRIDITFVYDGRITVRLGSASDLDKKLNMCSKAIADEDKVSRYQTGTLDVSVAGKAYFDSSAETVTTTSAATTAPAAASAATSSASTTAKAA